MDKADTDPPTGMEGSKVEIMAVNYHVCIKVLPLLRWEPLKTPQTKLASVCRSLKVDAFVVTVRKKTPEKYAIMKLALLKHLLNHFFPTNVGGNSQTQINK